MSKNEMIMLPREVVERAPAALDAEDPYRAAEALRAALEQPQNHVPNAGNMVPASWKLVPVELTQAMIDQMRFGWSDISTAHILDRWKRTVAAAPQPPAVEMTTDEWIDRNVSGNQDLIKAMKIIARPESVEHDRPQPPKHYDQQALDLCPTCGWKTMIPGDCYLICARQKPQVEQEPYLYYDPANGDTWTQEAINDGCCLPDGLIALYTK